MHHAWIAFSGPANAFIYLSLCSKLSQLKVVSYLNLKAFGMKESKGINRVRLALTLLAAGVTVSLV